MGKLLGSPALIAIQNLLENKRCWKRMADSWFVFDSCWSVQGGEIHFVTSSVALVLCRVSMGKELVFTHPLGKH